MSPVAASTEPNRREKPKLFSRLLALVLTFTFPTIWPFRTLCLLLTVAALAYGATVLNPYHGTERARRDCLVEQGVIPCLKRYKIKRQDLSVFVNPASHIAPKNTEVIDVVAPCSGEVSDCRLPHYLSEYAKDALNPLPSNAEAVLIHERGKADHMTLAAQVSTPNGPFLRAGNFDVEGLPYEVEVLHLAVPWDVAISLPQGHPLWSLDNYPIFWSLGLILVCFAIVMLRPVLRRLRTRPLKNIPILLAAISRAFSLLFLLLSIGFFAGIIARQPAGEFCTFFLLLSASFLVPCSIPLELDSYSFFRPSYLFNNAHQTPTDAETLDLEDYEILRLLHENDFFNFMVLKGIHPTADDIGLDESMFLFEIDHELRRHADWRQKAWWTLRISLGIDVIGPTYAKALWTDPGREVPEELCVRLKSLIDRKYIEGRGNQLFVTLSGLEAKVLPSAVFVRRMPVHTQRDLIEAEQRLRRGESVAAIRTCGTLLEVYLREAIVDRLLPSSKSSEIWNRGAWLLAEPKLWTKAFTKAVYNRSSASAEDQNRAIRQRQVTLLRQLNANRRGKPKGLWTILQPVLNQSTPARSGRNSSTSLAETEAAIRCFLGVTQEDIWGPIPTPKDHTLNVEELDRHLKAMPQDATGKAWDVWRDVTVRWVREQTLAALMDLCILLLECQKSKSPLGRASQVGRAITLLELWEDVIGDEAQAREKAIESLIPEATRHGTEIMGDQIRLERNTYVHNPPDDPNVQTIDAWHMIHLVRVFISLCEQ